MKTFLVTFLLSILSLGSQAFALSFQEENSIALDQISSRVNSLMTLQDAIKSFPWEGKENHQIKRDSLRHSIALDAALYDLGEKDYLGSSSILELFKNSTDNVSARNLERHLKIQYSTFRKDKNFKAAAQSCYLLFETEVIQDPQNWVQSCARSFFLSANKPDTQTMFWFSQWLKQRALLSLVRDHFLLNYYIAGTFLKYGNLESASQFVKQNWKSNLSNKQKVFKFFLEYLKNKEFASADFSELNRVFSAMGPEDKKFFYTYLGYFYRNRANFSRSLESFQKVSTTGESKKIIDAEIENAGLSLNNKFSITEWNSVHKPFVSEEDIDWIKNLNFDPQMESFDFAYQLIYLRKLMAQYEISHPDMTLATDQFLRLFQISQASENMKDLLSRSLVGNPLKEIWDVDQKNKNLLKDIFSLSKETEKIVSLQYKNDMKFLSQEKKLLADELMRRISFDENAGFQKYFFRLEAETRERKFKKILDRIQNIYEDGKQLIREASLAPTWVKNSIPVSPFDQTQISNVVSSLKELEDFKTNIYIEVVQEMLSSQEVVNVYRQQWMKTNALKQLATLMHEALENSYDELENIDKTASRRTWRRFLSTQNKTTTALNKVTKDSIQFRKKIISTLKSIHQKIAYQRTITKDSKHQLFSYVAQNWHQWQDEILKNLLSQNAYKNFTRASQGLSVIQENKESIDNLKKSKKDYQMWIDAMNESIELGLFL